MNKLREPYSYCNSELRAPRNTKPHIALRFGWWRVTPLPRPLRNYATRALWEAAYAEAARRNSTPGL